ncbi:glycosyltransferase family 2 protein [uncultured Jannaschia sp.]|uniref:glycosyltransferase family 2 protein n=1 Tax=uncultured Jannaschia sp. TaxID=293347 RepID=UPI0026243A05|nr:glycosyltransferase family 2 protein [uncultured Jannaschia sp.]
MSSSLQPSDFPDLPEAYERPAVERAVLPFPESAAPPEAAPLDPISPPGPAFRHVDPVRRPRLGEVLLDMGVIGQPDLTHALMLQRRFEARLGDVLLRRGLVSSENLARAMARQRGLGRADAAPRGCPRSDEMARRLPHEIAIAFLALPWDRIGGLTRIATARPERLDELRDAVAPYFDACVFVVATDAEIEARLAIVHGDALARAAECRVPAHQSCRHWKTRSAPALFAIVTMLAILAISEWPATALRLAIVAAVGVSIASLALRFAALIAVRLPARRGFASVRPPRVAMRKLPCVTILVPLHREPDIARPLTERLSRLDYPRELLDICLVVEAGDTCTLEALDGATLPPWMRVIPVPDGHPRTKPRAMNYALNFARGEIVGIYDAEDAPAPDQIRTIVERFEAAPATTACLQGQLDFYNPTRNWMARCFTIEYANWFRLMLPGIARMGLVVPLGGTTLFFRRDVLEAVGGWDAHNVTEDADLGVRLARGGWRTEIVPTTTLEEANASPMAWVRQRSRWIKGYMMTWAVHSRDPVRLWRDLGPKRFFGFHLLFLTSVLSAALLPVLWSLAVLIFGIGHPIEAWLPPGGAFLLGAVMAGLSLVSILLTFAGCAAAHHRHLRPWIPTLMVYFPLATLALLKAAAEVASKPFHWDKTEHGTFGGVEGDGDIETLQAAMAAPPGR